MHQIIAKDQLSPNVTRLVVEAPRIAAIRRPGQFVIVRRGAGAERIPLTICDGDPTSGTISLVIQSVGKSTADLVELEPGEAIADVAGPLGRPTDLIESGHAVCVGGGVGTAVILPIALELQRRGVTVTSIIGGRSREWVILESELAAAGAVVPCTDDGSYGRPGFVTEALADALAGGGVDAVYAVGPVPMMRAVAELTAPLGVPTVVSLNPDHGRRHGHVRRLPGHGRRRHPLRLCRRPRVRWPPSSTSPSWPTAYDLPRLRARCPGPPRTVPRRPPQGVGPGACCRGSRTASDERVDRRADLGSLRRSARR